MDFGIIGISGIDESGALLDFDYREVRVAQAIIANARRTFLVADASKFKRSAPVRIGRISDIHGFFTDTMPPEPIQKICEELGVRLAVAEPV